MIGMYQIFAWKSMYQSCQFLQPPTGPCAQQETNKNERTWLKEVIELL